MSNQVNLAQKIKQAISNIPASNPGVTSFDDTTLRDNLSDSLLNKIANVAATIKPDSSPAREKAIEALRQIIEVNQVEQRRTVEVDPAGNTYEIRMIDGPFAIMARPALVALLSESPDV